jgi:predicted alpha/beta-fold hydrolase
MLRILIVAGFVILSFYFVNGNKHENNVIFTVYKENISSSFEWKPSMKLTVDGCLKTDKFAILTHGWRGSTSSWIIELVKKLLKYRGGCVITMNWGVYSDNINYEKVVIFDWPDVSAVLLKRLKQLEAEGVSPDDIFMFGHSLGARLVIDAGINFGKGRIAQIDGKFLPLRLLNQLTECFG